MNRYLKISSIIGFGLLVVSCRNNQGNSAAETTTPVWIEDVQYRNIEEYITTTGTAKATKTIELKSETNGAYRLQTNPKTGRPYQLGDIVEAGAVIVRLENQEYENNVQLESKNYKLRLPKKNGKDKKYCMRKEEQHKRRNQMQKIRTSMPSLPLRMPILL